MGIKLAPDKERARIAFLAAVTILLWPNAYMQILIIVVAGCIVVLRGKSVSMDQRQSFTFPVRKRTGLISLCIFVGLLVCLPLIRHITANNWIGVFDSFYRIGSLVFGGGHVVLPLLEKEVVSVGWVEQSQFLTGYGLAQAVPGPLFTFAAYLGVAMGGWRMAVVTIIAIFLPSLLLVIGIMPFWDSLRTKGSLQSALWAINAAVVGILLAALYNPVWISAIGNSTDFTIAIICFGLLQFWRVPPLCVVIGACLLTL